MSRQDKLLAKLLNKKASFSWKELETLLMGFGYQKLEGAGSRVKFDNGDPGTLISLHKPHPGSELKFYARRQVIEQLRAGGIL